MIHIKYCSRRFVHGIIFLSRAGNEGSPSDLIEFGSNGGVNDPYVYKLTKKQMGNLYNGKSG